MPIHKKKEKIILDNKEKKPWKDFFYSKWGILFILIVFLIVTLSLRLLSDPDLGFHLKAGKWIIQNLSFPQKDTFTFTVNNNDYIDLHWLFQIFIYFIFSISNYEGLSILVLLVSMLLLFFTLKRILLRHVPLNISCIVLLIGFLLIEPRLALRPEIFSFLYLSVILIILELYFYSHKNYLLLLPVIMLFWVNTHGLFILGFMLMGAYFLSLWIKEKKFDKQLFLWCFCSLFICLLNPYFAKGFLLPFELFTRLGNNNVYNQNILELKSFSNIKTYSFIDYLFMFFSLLTFLLSLRFIKKHYIHDFILLLVFFYLAFTSIRNIPIFVIIAMPILSKSLYEFSTYIKEKKWYSKTKFVRFLLFFLLLFFSVGLTIRSYTGVYHISNRSYSKFGLGLDKQQQPDAAVKFLLDNKLNGKIINSLGYGGWLEWNLPQPIFIDGRQEVMKEELYQEIINSWNGGLRNLIDKYKPKLLFFNYLKYYIWSVQLTKMTDWRIIYLDGEVVIFASNDYATNIPALNMTNLPIQYKLPKDTNEEQIKQILSIRQPTKLNNWVEGFYKKYDYSCDDITNIASFCLQFKEYKVAEQFFIESLRKSKGNKSLVYYALADIYKINKNQVNLQICLSKINKLRKKPR